MTYKFMQEMQKLPYITIEGSIWYGSYRQHGVCFWSVDEQGNRGFGVDIIPEEMRVLFFDGSPEDIVFECSSEGLEQMKQTVAKMIKDICAEIDRGGGV